MCASSAEEYQSEELTIKELSPDMQELSKQVFPSLFDLDLAYNDYYQSIIGKDLPYIERWEQLIAIEKQFFKKGSEPLAFSIYWNEMIALSEAMVAEAKASDRSDATLAAIQEKHEERRDAILSEKHLEMHKLFVTFVGYEGLPSNGRLQELAEEIDELRAIEDPDEPTERRLLLLDREYVELIRKDWETETKPAK